MTTKQMLENNMSAEEMSNQIAKEHKERIQKVEQLAKEMGVSVAKVLSLIKQRERATEYRKQQQILSKKMTELFEKDASYRRVFSK